MVRAAIVLIKNSLTSSGVCGASMEPMRPTMEHMPNIEFRNLVGKISAVNT